MMATQTRIHLSKGAGGILVNIPKTATPGTPVHSAAGGASMIDYLTIRASNQTTIDTIVTMEFNGSTDSDIAKISVPGQVGFVTILDRKPLGSSFVFAAFAARSSVINLDGWVDRVTT